jgi:hypothetical protein
VEQKRKLLISSVRRACGCGKEMMKEVPKRSLSHFFSSTPWSSPTGQQPTILLHQSAPPIQLATNNLPKIRLLKSSSHYTFTLKMATAMLSEMLDNAQHSMQLTPEAEVTH